MRLQFRAVLIWGEFSRACPFLIMCGFNMKTVLFRTAGFSYFRAFSGFVVIESGRIMMSLWARFNLFMGVAPLAYGPVLILYNCRCQLVSSPFRLLPTQSISKCPSSYSFQSRDCLHFLSCYILGNSAKQKTLGCL